MAQIPTAPPFLKGVLGKNADVREIPETSAVGEGRLNFNSGFPAENALPPSAGGVAPQREDFNAVNKLVTQHLYWLQAGGCYPWRNDLDYIKGCHAMGSDDKEYICQRWCGPGSTAGAKDPTDSESGNYWWAPAEETQIAANTAAIEELTKTVSTAVSDVTEAVAKVETVSTQVNTNTSDITSLKGRVTTNEGDIDKLESRMTSAEELGSNHTEVLDAISTALSTAENNVADLQSRITSAEGNISDNDTDIAGLTTRMTAAEGTISTHTSDISGLASRVSTNETNIKSNTDDIESLASSLSSLKNDVDTDEEIIASNSNRIAANEGSISTNTSDIAALKTSVATNTTNITTNAGNISTLQTQVATNTSDIAALAGDTSITEKLTELQGYVDVLEARRKAMIGVPFPSRSTTIPEGYAVADGSFVLFSNYPELKEVYEAGGFEGMLLAYNASSTAIANSLGKWRPDASTPTGLYLPNLDGRYLRSGASGTGATVAQSLPNINGCFTMRPKVLYANTPTSPFSINAQGVEVSGLATGTTAWANIGYCEIRFNAASYNSIYNGSSVNPAAVEFPYIVYLGRYAVTA